MLKSYVIPKSKIYTPIPIAENTEELNLNKSYKDVWKRALKKIKIGMVTQRISNILRLELHDTNSESKISSQNRKTLKYSISTKVSIPILIIAPHRAFFILWTLLNLIILLYISTYGLYWAAFYEYDPKSVEAKIELITELLFLLDIIVNSNLAYFDYDNKLITARKKILKNYLFTTFIFDCFTSFPYAILIRDSDNKNNPQIFLFRIIPKIIRWLYIKSKLRCFYFIKNFDESMAKHKHFYDILIATSVIIIIIHFTACLFFLAARYENISSTTWVMQSNLQDLSEIKLYCAASYWSILTLSLIGYGDIHPYNPLEMIIAMLAMAIGLFLLSVVSSILLFAVNKLTNSDIAFQDNLDLVDRFAVKTGIKGRLIKRLKLCIRNKNLISKEVPIDKALDPHDMKLRYEVAMSMYNKALTKIPFFYNKSTAFTSHFAFKLIFSVYENGELAWAKGCYSDGIYFVTEGKLKIMHDGVVCHIAGLGNYIGDFEIFLKSERKFDVVSGSITKCMKMNKDCLREMKTHFPDYFMKMKEKSKERIEKLMDEIALMVGLKQNFRGDFKYHNKEIYRDIKKKLYYRMFAENFHVMENKRILDLMRYCREFSECEKRVKGIICRIMDMHGIKEDESDFDEDYWEY